MASRKRPSETAVVSSNSNSHHKETYDAMTTDEASLTDPTMSSSLPSKTQPRPRLRIRIRRFHGVAQWTWNAGSEDEVCGICQSAFEGVAPGVKYPGDECPVVFGRCGHAFHLQCISTWLNSSRNTCPICRREWEFGQSSDQRSRTDN